MLLFLCLPRAGAEEADDPLRLPTEDRCRERYHTEQKFLANPDESVIVAAVIGWCRSHSRRILWDERYAAAARAWSGLLVQAGEVGERTLAIDRLRFELLQRGVTDQALEPYAALGTAEKTPEGLTRFLDEQVEQGRFTHFAAGCARLPGQEQMVTTVILGRRPAEIGPLPVCPLPGERIPLSLHLREAYSHPRWLMTTPRGDVIDGNLLYEEGTWRGDLPLDAGRGEYTLEIAVSGPVGPEVAALCPLFAGVPRPSLPRVKLRPAPVRYQTPEEAEAALLKLINTDRGRLRLPALGLQPTLSKLAREHALELLISRHATHRTKATGALIDRLRKNGLGFERALENVALVPSPETAHERFLASPSHRKNILDPGVNQLGLGIAMERGPTEDIMALCEVFVEQSDSSGDRLTADKILQLVNQRRETRGRFALGLDAALSRLARQSVRRLAAQGAEAKPTLESEALAALIEEKLGAKSAQVRIARTRDPALVVRAPEVIDEAINRLGVGVASAGDDGAPMWIALIFAGM